MNEKCHRRARGSGPGKPSNSAHAFRQWPGISLACCVLLCVQVVGQAQENAPGEVTFKRLVGAPTETGSWLTYSGRYSGWRYSTLALINTGNVSRLRLEWAFQTSEVGQFETTSLVVDGVLYGTGQNNRAFALDARTGRAIWRYQRNLPEKLQLCCGKVNRGFAILGSRLFMTTLDGHVIALDAKTGNVLWDVTAADHHRSYSFTVAPLAVHDKVIVGVSGGEYGIRGFVDAYDAQSGRRVWRFYTVPGPGQSGHETWTGNSWKTGGAPAWTTGSYDPELNLVYWPTGNPAPSNYGVERGGDNLYSNCMLALDADSGQLKWHFQFTPHDLYDYDATQIPLLIDADWEAQPRHLLVQANRNGFIYVLDRTDGTFLTAKPFGPVSWTKGIDPNGRPVVDPATRPSDKGVLVCPGSGGLTNWFSPSYDPDTGLVYVATNDECDVFSGMPQSYRAGHDFVGSAYVSKPDKRPSGAIEAFDPFTGQRTWRFKHFSSSTGGILSTAGGLAFSGDSDGNFIALDAHTGQDLWHIQLGAPVFSAAVTYVLDGRQFVVIPAGGALFAFSLPGE
jgi:alcohol dehydrogenase (cytochrome c)